MGHVCLVFSHCWIQSKWYTWPQLPHAIESPASFAVAGLAWYSMLGSVNLFLQMAHLFWIARLSYVCARCSTTTTTYVSVDISQLHMATPFQDFNLNLSDVTSVHFSVIFYIFSRVTLSIFQRIKIVYVTTRVSSVSKNHTYIIIYVHQLYNIHSISSGSYTISPKKKHK